MPASPPPAPLPQAITPSSVATALDAGPWVAVQRAMDRSLNVLIDGMYELGDAILLPRAGHRIRARDKNCGFSKSTSTLAAYLSPCMTLTDVMNVELDGLLFDIRNNVRQVGARIAPTAMGTTGGIRFIDCRFNGGGSVVERFSNGIIYERCVIDGLGDFSAPSKGALGGIATGGSTDQTTGGGVNSDGLVSNIWIVDCVIRNTRSELIDINWNTSNVYIINLIGDNWGTDGTVNEAIDVGGGSGAAVCSNIYVINPTLTTTGANGSHGVHFKLGSRHCALVGGELSAPAQGTVTSYGVLIQGCSDVRVEGVTIRGFTTSVNSGGNTALRIVRNHCDGPYSNGIGAAGDTQISVEFNTVIGIAGGTSLNRPIILQSCTNYKCMFNVLTGSWNGNAILIDANCSGLCLANDNFTGSSISNQGTRSAAGLNAINEIGGLPITGGTLTGNLQVNGTAITQLRAGDDVNAPQFIGSKARGTASAPTAVLQNDQAASFGGRAYTGASYVGTMQMLNQVTAATPSATDMQSRLTILLCAAGAVTVTAALSIDHVNGLNLYGSTVIDSNRVFRLRSYTVATLPTAGIAGRTAYASNGRAFTGAGGQEAAGAGTGVEVNDNGSAWRVAGTNATVSA